MAYYPNYFNPYVYQNTQSYTSNNIRSLEWVEGEVGAKAFQMPQGWPAETPIALWDSTEKKIFLKSWNNIGMANPLQEIDYTIKEKTNPALLQNMSGSNMDNYVTKKDFDQLKQELHNMSDVLTRLQNRDSNRGGNR